MLASPPAHWPKLQHVDLGIDLAEFSARPTASHDDGLELLTVGRLSPEKGHRLLLDAMGALRHLPVRLRIVGDGPDRAFLESEVRRRDLGESVLFEGRVSQPRLEELYRQAGAFILGSLYEGTPIVLMEAMAMQIPCLAPMINGVPEVVAHGKTGLLFSPGDAAALAEQVQILLREPGVRDEFARAGREAVIAHYDLQKNTARWANVLAASLPGMSSR
jgi:glycosyltransferase involved in cell wall biosynthesis